WYWTGKSYAEYDQREEARRAFDSSRAIMKNGSSVDEALYELGILAERDGNLTAAIAEYQQLFDEYPHSSILLLAKLREAECMIGIKNYAGASSAVDMVQALISRSEQPGASMLIIPEDVNAQIQFLRGEISSGTNDYIKAGVLFAHAMNFPHGKVLHKKILFELGWSAFKSENYGDAVAFFDSVNAVELPNDELNDRADFYSALALYKLDQFKDAESRMVRIAANGDNTMVAEANLELAARRFAEGSTQDAKKYCDRAIKYGRGSLTEARAEDLRGEILLSEKQFADAAHDFRQAVNTLDKLHYTNDRDADEIRSQALSRGGYALNNAGEYGESVQMLNEYFGRYAKTLHSDEALFWLAESYYHLNAFQNARDAYKKIIIEYSESDRREDALYGAGWSEFRMREFHSADKDFSQLIAEYPHTRYLMDALLRRADGLYLARDFKGAAHSYDEAWRKSEHSEYGEYAAYQLASCYMKLGERENAISTLRKFVAADPSSKLAPESRYLIGWNYFEEKKYPEAINAMQEVLAASPDSSVAAKAMYAIGDAQYNAGNYQAALGAYQKLINVYPSSPFVNAALTSEQYCLNFLGQDTLASVVVQDFIEKNPNLPNAQELAFKQGDMFYNTQRYGDAVKEYDAVAKRFPSTDEAATATYWEGMSYLNMSDTAQAIESFTMLQQKFPHAPITSSAVLELAGVYAHQQETAKAKNAYDGLLHDYPASRDAANGAIDYANMLLTMVPPDTAKAIDILSQTSSTAGQLEAGARAQIVLGMIDEGQGRTADAQAAFAAVAQRTDGLGAEAQYRLGESYKMLGNYSDAITALLRVKSDFGSYDDWVTQAMLSLGDCYEATSQRDLARESYQTILAFHHDDDAAKEAQKRLKKLQHM
ncbi:MAG TPA: tetratricopeptide repeat protein, partial [Candidatus Kapabacteria bacterium]|nr:tetratricopeptide repeat protein [Candidatus Kapabacteria bacterium]